MTDPLLGKIQCFSLPWPPATLSPNGSHGHWSKHQAARNKYKADCHWSAKSQHIRPMDDNALTVEIVFHAPTNRAYDLDNHLARIKSGLDAVSSLIGIDDSKWEYVLRRGGKEKSGRVAVTLRPAVVSVPVVGVIK